jgi:short-subunit dehydrogenase
MKTIVFGSHKGLGFECVKALMLKPGKNEVLGFSRKDSGFFLDQKNYQFKSYDFTKVYNDEDLFQQLLAEVLIFEPDNILYCAGGGPYGEYTQKNWKDHEWAIKLNFLFPAKLLWALSSNLKPAKDSSQSLNSTKFFYVGSSIAESVDGDAHGPSYAASKWAMKGLIASIKAAESDSQSVGGSALNKNLDIRLFSPGYMDTELLPPGAAPRTHGDVIQNPGEVAKEILSFLEN